MIPRPGGGCKTTWSKCQSPWPWAVVVAPVLIISRDSTLNGSAPVLLLMVAVVRPLGVLASRVLMAAPAAEPV